MIGTSSTFPHVIRVLAVDDELPALRLLLLLLRPPAFHCTAANNGEEALVALQQYQFDVVISDLIMSGISGMDLLSEARRRLPYVAFLVITGVDDVEVGVQAMRAGADDYLVKPLFEIALLASIERALERRRLEQEVETYRLHLEDLVVVRTAQLQAALRETEHSYEDTLQALGAAIDLRDNQTAGHSRRVCAFSLAMARVMGLSDNQLVTISRGAYLHDIGKLGVPDSILLKPGTLNGDEWKLMQKHVQIGFDLVKGIPFLADAAEIVFTHHERFDGSGYPRGLKAQEIPLGARIFGVADTLDAISSDRPYRRATSFEDARDTILALSGRHFDPEVVEIFLSIQPKLWPEIALELSQMVALTPRSRQPQSIALLGPESIS